MRVWLLNSRKRSKRKHKHKHKRSSKRQRTEGQSSEPQPVDRPEAESNAGDVDTTGGTSLPEQLRAGAFTVQCGSEAAVPVSASELAQLLAFACCDSALE